MKPNLNNRQRFYGSTDIAAMLGCSQRQALDILEGFAVKGQTVRFECANRVTRPMVRREFFEAYINGQDNGRDKLVVFPGGKKTPKKATKSKGGGRIVSMGV